MRDLLWRCDKHRGPDADFPALRRQQAPLVTDRESVRLMRELLDGQGRKAEISTEVEVRDDSSRLICRGSFVWKLRRSRGRATAASRRRRRVVCGAA
jgi:hypothetical protein